MRICVVRSRNMLMMRDAQRRQAGERVAVMFRWIFLAVLTALVNLTSVTTVHEKVTVDFALSRLRLHRIEAACIPENAPSIALLERNSFQREGYARGFLRINGAWRDHVLFGLVQSDARPRLAWTNLD